MYVRGYWEYFTEFSCDQRQKIDLALRIHCIVAATFSKLGLPGCVHTWVKVMFQ